MVIFCTLQILRNDRLSKIYKLDGVYMYKSELSVTLHNPVTRKYP